MIRATEMIDKGQFADTLNEYFERKGKGDPKNLKCFALGYEKTVKM